MANLIITVISIALVAVAALMGVYYGGSAFLDGQTRAKFNQLMSGAEQISAAATLYSLSHNGQLDDGNIPGNPTADALNFLVPNYLSVVPKKIDEGAGFLLQDLPTGGLTNTNGVTYSIQSNTSTTLRLCEMIAKAARGPTGTPKKQFGVNRYNLLPTNGGKFDCLWFPNDESATVPDSSDGFGFVYRIR